MKNVMVIAVVIAEFFTHFYSSRFDLGMCDFKIEKSRNLNGFRDFGGEAGI